LRQDEFKGFFEKYFDPVRSYIYYNCGDANLATDIAQEVFVTVWGKKFDLQDKRIKGLLYKMAKEMFISRYRRMMVERRYIESIRFDYEELSADTDFEYSEMKERYEAALARLPATQREVFLMSRNEQLKYSEIAERLEISVKAVEKRMTGALAYLRKVLDINEK
jgi:RNA polymerase sigma-70 factor (ECF subfamily)